jgi:tetratricopeptide (TPR) repeat protein
MDILSKHLQYVTRIYNADAAGWQHKCDTFKKVDLEFNPAVHRDLCDKGSVKLRNQGNEHFKAGSYPEARLLYTQSIAAGVGGPLGALAYANRFEILSNQFRLKLIIYCHRSAALFHMQLYKDCIKDIDRALILGYPNHQLKYNLHLRKAMCLQFLIKDHTEALNDTLQVKCIQKDFKNQIKIIHVINRPSRSTTKATAAP